MRDFNTRFDEVAGAAPTGTITEEDLKQYYLRAIGKGDSALLRQAVWNLDIEVTSLMRLQKQMVKKLDNFVILAGSSVPTPTAQSTSAAPPSEAGSVASSFSKLLKQVQEAKQAPANSGRVQQSATGNEGTRQQQT